MRKNLIYSLLVAPLLTWAFVTAVELVRPWSRYYRRDPLGTKRPLRR